MEVRTHGSRTLFVLALLCRANAEQLVRKNEALSESLEQSEKDTIVVISHMKQEAATVEETVHRLSEELKDTKRHARLQLEHVTSDLKAQLQSLKDILEDRDEEIAALRNELELLKDFRNQRAALVAELDELKVRLP